MKKAHSAEDPREESPYVEFNSGDSFHVSARPLLLFAALGRWRAGSALMRWRCLAWRLAGRPRRSRLMLDIVIFRCRRTRHIVRLRCGMRSRAHVFRSARAQWGSTVRISIRRLSRLTCIVIRLWNIVVWVRNAFRSMGLLVRVLSRRMRYRPSRTGAVRLRTRHRSVGARVVCRGCSSREVAGDSGLPCKSLKGWRPWAESNCRPTV